VGRRAHGDGSLYQRESDGRWVACVDLGVDLAGVRRRKEFSARTKKDASEKRAAWIKSGALARHRRVIEAATVAEVAKMWLDYLGDQGRKRATIAGYRCMYTVHVASSFLAPIRVDLVVREHVERLYRDLAAKGLSMRMRQAIHVVLNGIFKHAIERELIARSPMERIKRPGGSKQARVKPHHRVRVWTEEEVRQFVEVAKGTQYGPLFEVALGTGLPPGELYALRWGDLDLYRGTLSVRETLVECEGEVTFETPKTEQSRRTIKLAKTTVATLTAIGKRGRNDLVFATQLGAPCDRNNVRRSLRALARKAGLEERTPHELRHTHASLLLARGTPIKVVSERLGHRDVTTTLEVYQHLLPGMGERAADEIDAMLAA
jgi:integrase